MVFEELKRWIQTEWLITLTKCYIFECKAQTKLFKAYRSIYTSLTKSIRKALAHWQYGRLTTETGVRALFISWFILDMKSDFGSSVSVKGTKLKGDGL